MGKYGGTLDNKFDLSAYWEKYHNGNGYSANVPSHERPDFTNVLFSKNVHSWIDLENNLAKIVNNWGENPPGSWGQILYFPSIFNEFLIPKFEKYIAEVINKTDAQAKFKVTNADRVLSFNYSNTFERLYKQPNDKICYVNGKASTDEMQSHIVFGCDYYKSDDEKLSQFNKVFQRAYKNTNNKYKDWFQENENVHYNIFIVGHSLGNTDHDILRPFITNKNSETAVYYHSDESHRQLIHRMMNMVGTETMNQHHIIFRHINELEIEKTNLITRITTC
jgi:hypothetical protein